MGEWAKSVWTAEDYAALERYVRLLADEKHRAFNSRLIPGEAREIWGVRVPLLRNVAKDVARGDLSAFLNAANGTSHEMVSLEGMAITAAKLGFEEREKYYAAFAEKITNWAMCDTAVGKEKDANHFDEVAAYTKSARPFVIRFGLVRLLASYVNEAHISRVLEVAARIDNPHYYVRMANAWLLSVCYVNFPELTAPVLDAVDEETRKMAKQKIRDSYRVPKDRKKSL